MNSSICFPLITCFIIAWAIGPMVIRFLKGLHASQTEREELASHQKKEGTPTMGGFIFLIAIVAASFVFLPGHLENVPVLMLMLGFGVIGFIDDFLKVVLHRSDGLIAWQKFLLQIVVATVFIVYLSEYSNVSMTLRIPFLYGETLDIGLFIYPLLYLMILGTVNGVNFTDGLDGLATTVTLVVAGFFAIWALLSGQDVYILPIMVIGALMGFLVFNVYPAKVFMGDTGSLALGGFVAGMACVMNLPIFIILIGFIYLIEVISVILQVLYFKKTKGKRIFRMAPIHHHYELGGWSETRIVAIFSIVTALLCLLSFIALIPPQG